MLDIIRVFILISSMSMLGCGIASDDGVNRNLLDSSSTSDRPVFIPENIVNEPDRWKGTYKGLIPCAICNGIHVSLTLKENFTYELKSRYLGKEELNNIQRGKFQFTERPNTIALEGTADSILIYVIGDNFLTQLDAKQQLLNDAIIDDYKLLKSLVLHEPIRVTSIEGVKWRVREFSNGVTSAENSYILLDSTNNTIKGDCGCSQMGGTYTLLADHGIAFYPKRESRKNCGTLDDSLCAMFISSLELADNWGINEDRLVLNKSRTRPLVRLVAVD
jgi:hypothetical protein